MANQMTATSRRDDSNNDVDIESNSSVANYGTSIIGITPPNERSSLLPAVVASSTTTTTTTTTTTDASTHMDTVSNSKISYSSEADNQDVRELAVDGSNTVVDNTTTTTTAASDAAVVVGGNEAIPVSSIRQTAMSGFAGLGFVSSLISMMTEYSATAIQHPAIVVSGILGMILSPYAKFQQEKLTQVKALEQTNSVLEDELNYLKHQHEQISKRVAEVQETTTKLRAWQSTLTTMQSANIQSIDQLEQQVQQSREIVAQFQQNTQAMILQNLITVMIHCDQNHTMTLEDHEIDSLITSLESIHSVQINETKLRQLIIDQNQRSMTAIMEMARHLITNTPTLSSSTTADDVPTSTLPPGIATENDTIFSFIERE